MRRYVHSSLGYIFILQSDLLYVLLKYVYYWKWLKVFVISSNASFLYTHMTVWFPEPLTKTIHPIVANTVNTKANCMQLQEGTNKQTNNVSCDGKQQAYIESHHALSATVKEMAPSLSSICGIFYRERSYSKAPGYIITNTNRLILEDSN